MRNKKNIDTTVAKLNKAFNFLVNNPHSTFYKDKYLRSDIKLKSIKTLEQFQSLPYLTKDEILRVNPYDFVFIPKENINDIGISSGTTNKDDPLMLLLDMNARPALNITRFQPLIDLRVKTHLLLYHGMIAARRLRVNHPPTKKTIAYAVGDIGNLFLTAKIARQMQVESIETTASILYLFIPFLKKEYDLNKIKIIMIGGEYCSEAKYKYLQKAFKNAKFISDFGSVETGTIATRCKHLDKMPIRFFHPADFIYAEIFNQKEEGELVVTGLEIGKLPYLLRYRTGNHIRLTDYNCPCGETKLMEVFGKIGYDVLRVQGTFIYSNHIHQILSSYSEYLQITDFKLHVYEVIIKDKIMTRLVLQLIPKKQVKNLEKLKEEISKSLGAKLVLTPKNTLADLVSKEIFMPLEVEFVESFPFSPKQTGIVSHIV